MAFDNFFSPHFDIDSLPVFPILPTRKQIVWLASYPKSGNTWMRLFLSAYLANKSDADINQDLHENHQCNDPRLSRIIAKKTVSDFSDLDSARVRVGVQRLFTRNEQKIVVKTHSAVAAPFGHPSIDPHSTYASFFITRNPLAVLPSFARHMGLDLNDAVERMNDTSLTLGGADAGFPRVILSSWSSFTRSWLASIHELNVMPIKYEDMKTRPLETFGKALAHIRVPVDQERLARAISATDFKKLKAQDLSQGFKERTKADKGNLFFRSGKVDGWRQELSEAQVIATIRNHWDVMEQLDYIPTDLQGEFEDIKFNALEALVNRGANIGAYADDLNKLRTKRGIQSHLKVDARKTQVSKKEAHRTKVTKRRTTKKTFG